MKARFRNTLALARLEVGRSIWSTMRRRLSERMEAVATASRILVEQYRTVIASERAVAERSDQSEPARGPAHDVSLSVVHYRGGREELDLGLEYARSADPLDRVVGADVLAQLGWNDGEFLDESVEALIALLDDPDPSVVERAAFGLGHWADERAVSSLVRLAGHESPQMRLGIVFGLTCQEAPDAIGTLIRMSADPDRDVRSWATFGLGTQVETDTPELRAALYLRLSDGDSETRGEALVGLARRRDPRVVLALLQEWELHNDIGILSIEAAETMGDPALLTHLETFLATMDWSDGCDRFREGLLRAIAACRGEGLSCPQPGR